MRRALCYCLRTHDLCLTYRHVAASSTYDYQRVPNSAAGLDRCSRGDSPHACGVRVVVSGSVCASAVDSYGVTGSPRTVTCAPAERSGPGAVCVWRETIALIHTRHRDQGGVGHNNIFINKSTRCTRVAPTGSSVSREWRLAHHAPWPPAPRAAAGRGPRAKLGQRSKHGDEPRTRAASLQHHALHACTVAPQTLYHRARMHPIPFQIMGWPWVSIILHLRCPSTGLKPNVASATCPSFCRICLPVLMPYATTDPSAIRLRRLLGA